MYHGLAAVAEDTGGQPPRFAISPLPGKAPGMKTLKRWLRNFLEVRDSEGAERCITTAVRSGAGTRELADMMFAAATDHRYLTIGHVVDFTNKAFETLEHGAHDLTEPVLASLARSYANGDRMEESNSWRNPIDLVAVCELAFESLPAALEVGRRAQPGSWSGRDELVAVVLGEDPGAIADAMVAALGTELRPATWQARSPMSRRCGSRASISATSSAIGTPRIIASRSPARCIRRLSERRPPSCCARRSTPP